MLCVKWSEKPLKADKVVRLRTSTQDLSVSQPEAGFGCVSSEFVGPESKNLGGEIQTRNKHKGEMLSQHQVGWFLLGKLCV